jgi:hypothetical protein
VISPGRRAIAGLFFFDRAMPWARVEKSVHYTPETAQNNRLTARHAPKDRPKGPLTDISQP